MGFRNFSNFLLSLALIYLVFAILPTAYNAFATFSVALVSIRLAEWLMTNTRKYFLYNKVSGKRKAILITGCDSGFGHMLAKRMDTLGYRVFAGCLNPDGEGARLLEKICSNNLTVLSLDVTSDTIVSNAKEFVVSHLGDYELWAVVNNAGITHAGETDWASLEDFQSVHDVNAYGTIRVTKAFLSLLKKSRGRVVNNTSVCAHLGCPGFIGYAMSKSAALSFTKGLRVEMAKWGVKAISIEPFFYTTPLTKYESCVELVEKAWNRAPPGITAEYGEKYKEFFKESSLRLVGRSSTKVQEVIDCFEDALTAEEPLSSYFPCFLPDKIALKILLSLPSIVIETHQRNLLALGAKPAIL